MQENYNNTHKTTTTIHARKLKQYTQDNYNNTQGNYNNTQRQLTKIHARHLKTQHIQK